MAAKDIVERFETFVEKETAINEDDRVSFFEMLTPGFAGGMITGIIAGIPGLSILVFLYPLGGYYAAKLTKDYYEKNINAKDSAKVGAFAGFLGGFFASALLLICSIFFADGLFMFFRTLLGTANAETVMILAGIDPQISLYTMKLRFVVDMILCTILGMLGGVIFAIRRKK